jgi:hypothetical protein
LQPRYVHLGVAEPGRDGVLVEILEEPQDDGLAFQFGQVGDQSASTSRSSGFSRDPGGHQVTHRHLGVVAGRAVQRQPNLGLGGRPGLQQLLFGPPQVVGQLPGGGCPAVRLVELVGGLVQPQDLFLAGSGHMQPPAGVAQVAFKLADDAGNGEGHEGRPLGRVVAVDGRDQPRPDRLGEILRGGSAALAVAAASRSARPR